LIGSRGMDHQVRSCMLKSILHQVRVGNGSLDQGQVRIGLEVVAPAGGKVVNDPHVIAAGQQSLSQMGSDKTRSPCDENVHIFLLEKSIADFTPRERRAHPGQASSGNGSPYREIPAARFPATAAPTISVRTAAPSPNLGAPLYCQSHLDSRRLYR